MLNKSLVLLSTMAFCLTSLSILLTDAQLRAVANWNVRAWSAVARDQPRCQDYARRSPICNRVGNARDACRRNCFVGRLRVFLDRKCGGFLWRNSTRRRPFSLGFERRGAHCSVWSDGCGISVRILHRNEGVALISCDNSRRDFPHPSVNCRICSKTGRRV